MNRNSINIIQKDNIKVVSSLEVTENFNKRHDNVLAKIEKEIENFNHLKIKVVDYFIESTYKDNKGEERKEYLLTRDGFSYIAMGFTGKESSKWKVKYIDAFNKMEEIIKQQQQQVVDVHSYMIDDPIERAKKWIVEQEEKKKIEEENKIKNKQLEEQKPKVKTYDRFIDKSHTLGFRELRKELESATGIILKENELKQIMRDKKLIGKTVKASASAIRDGYAATKDVEDIYGKTRTQDRFTMKCREELIEYIEEYFILE